MTWWHWYIGRDNELLIDLDSSDWMRVRLFYLKHKLRRNWNRGFLKWETVHIYRSIAAYHCHVFVTLPEAMHPIERAMWELELGSDPIRGRYNVMRTLRGLAGADLLIANRRYEGFREPDYHCECKGKHNEDRITKHCPVLRHLHGDQAGAEYFAVNNDRRDRTERFEWPVGLVPAKLILKS